MIKHTISREPRLQVNNFRSIRVNKLVVEYVWLATDLLTELSNSELSGRTIVYTTGYLLPLIADHCSLIRGQRSNHNLAGSKDLHQVNYPPNGISILISWQSLRWLIGSIMKRVTPSGLRTRASLWSWAAPWCTAWQWSHLLLFAPSSFLPLSHLTSQPSH